MNPHCFASSTDHFVFDGTTKHFDVDNHYHGTFHQDVPVCVYIYYERSEFLIVGDGNNSTQKTCAVAVHGAITGQSNP